MELTTLQKNFQKLAPQFKCPSGSLGLKVGKQMDKLNDQQNDWVISLLGLQPDDLVLEIGFGTGKTLVKVANIVKEGRIYGLEASSTMYNEASKNLAKGIKEGKVKLNLGNAKKLPYTDDSFNKVYAVHVVYFWDNLYQVLSEIKRVTKKTGLIAIYFVSPILAPTPQFHEYSQEEIKKTLKKAGFKQVEIKDRKFGPQNGICILAVK